MAECKVIVNRPNSSSPPPNCAICLGTFSNKCFSDSCMHQFCFQCLLEWSKIKPECPLCKQPFTRIIHNVKSNEEYDEHLVEITPSEDIHIIDNEDFLYLPIGNPPPATRHHFHFRTTFTVDTRGEHAIQQMLLTHPLTNGGQISVGYPPSRSVIHRRRRDPTTTTTSFRRSIYTRNLWVSAPPDVTGRYRDISPAFFRDCPGARTRLVPWLNRELNALLYENTQLVMRLVDIIMDHLLRNHICSRTFRNLLFDYLDNKTDHFIHEFYNFMRSPFDMIGYDRNVIYSERPQSPLPYVVTLQDEISDEGNDSDVIIVGSTNPEEPVVIDLINTDSDEPILVSHENPVLIPVPENDSEPEPEPRIPVLPLKLRLKHKRQTREKKKEKKRKRSRHHRSSSSSSSSSTSSTDSSKDSYKRYKRRRKMRKLKKLFGKSPSERELRVNTSSDSEDDIPLLTLARKKKQMKNSNKSVTNLFKSSKNMNVNLSTNPAKEISHGASEGESPERSSLPSCSRYASDSSCVQNGMFKTEENDSEPIDYSRNGRDKSSSSTNAPSCSKYAFTTSDSSPNMSAQYRVVGGTMESSDDELSDEDYPAHQVVKSEVTKLYPDNINCQQYSKRLQKIFVKSEYC